MKEILAQYFALQSKIETEVTPQAESLGEVYRERCRALWVEKANEYGITDKQPTWFNPNIEPRFNLDDGAFIDFEGYHQIRLHYLIDDMDTTVKQFVQTYVNKWERDIKKKQERIAALEKELATLKGSLQK